MRHWLTSDALNAATSAPLSRSKYARAFLHPIIRLEDALYEWTPDRQWEKHVNPRVELQGPTFWDIQKQMRKRSSGNYGYEHHSGDTEPNHLRGGWSARRLGRRLHERLS